MRWWTPIMMAAAFGAGLGSGFLMGVASEPALIVQTEWKTVTTAPSEPVVLGHTSLNEDELRTLLTIMATTTTTTRPPTTTTTIRPTPPTVPTPSVVTPTTFVTTTIPPTTTTTIEPTTTTTEG